MKTVIMLKGCRSDTQNRVMISPRGRQVGDATKKKASGSVADSCSHGNLTVPSQMASYISLSFP